MTDNTKQPVPRSRHSLMKRIHVRNAITETIRESEYFSHVILHSPWTHDNVIDVTIERMKSKLSLHSIDVDIYEVIENILDNKSAYAKIPLYIEDKEDITWANIYDLVDEIIKKLFEF